MSGTQRSMGLHGIIVSGLAKLENTVLTKDRSFQSSMSVCLMSILVQVGRFTD